MAFSVIGLGAGGHAKVLIETLQLLGQHQLVGLLERNPGATGHVMGIPILGNDMLLAKLADKGITHFFVGVGSIGNTAPRIRLYELAVSYRLEAVEIIHPTAIIAPSVQYGKGFVALAGSIVNTAATIGDHVLINTGAIVEHDCSIGDHVHIASGAKLASTVRVGRGAHIGAGAVIRQAITIGENATVGLGAVVVKDVPENVTVVGCPARILKHKS